MSDSDGAPGGNGGAPTCRTGEQDEKYATFSNYAGSSADQKHTIAGPGVCIYSTWLNGAYNTISGTSMATPHLSGAVTLCIGSGGTAGPCAGKTPAQIIQKLTSDAKAYSTGTNWYGFTGDPLHSPVSGKYYGYLTYANDYASGDTTPPIVSSVNPSDRATGVALYTNVTATFSEDMDATTLTASTFTLAPVDSSGNVGQPITVTVSYDSATKKATLDPFLDPSVNLNPNAKYTATIKGGSSGVKNAAGNPLASDKVWSFTTGTPPKVSSVSPADNKTGVKPSTNVKALFSKAIDKATLTSSTFTLAPVDSSSGNVGPSIEATLTLSSDGKTATLNPFGSTSTNVLDPCTWYEATVTTGVKDKAGNSLDQGLNTTGYQPKTWRFKTSDC